MKAVRYPIMAIIAAVVFLIPISISTFHGSMSDVKFRHDTFYNVPVFLP
jgi:hypothetical protein